VYYDGKTVDYDLAAHLVSILYGLGAETGAAACAAVAPMCRRAHVQAPGALICSAWSSCLTANGK
jgi:hypothetical protein